MILSIPESRGSYFFILLLACTCLAIKQISLFDASSLIEDPISENRPAHSVSVGRIDASNRDINTIPLARDVRLIVQNHQKDLPT